MVVPATDQSGTLPLSALKTPPVTAEPAASSITSAIHVARLPGVRNDSLDRYLAVMPEWDASDFHISPDRMSMRIKGDLRTIQELKLDDLSILNALAGWLRPEQREEWDRNKVIDFGVTVGEERFRGHAHLSSAGTEIIFRHIPHSPPTISELRMPESTRSVLYRLCTEKRGLILVTGSTGSGKSTTLAAMMSQILTNTTHNVTTLEKPIEYNLSNIKDILGRISQREVGLHVSSFTAGIQHAMRSDPDVIMVGEITSPAELQAALQAAETGHLVCATLHTRGAVSALTRIIDMCENDVKNLVRAQLADCLRGVIFQCLVPTEQHSRMAVCEVLLDTHAVRGNIRKDNLIQLESIMQGSGAIGMARLDDMLIKLVKDGVISVETAVNHANSKDEVHKELGTGKLRLA